MKTRIAFVATLFLLAALVSAAGEPANGPAPNAKAAFEQLKTLAGEWEVKAGPTGPATNKAGPTGPATNKEAGGSKARATYQVLASGSIVLERFTSSRFPSGSDMITIYHLDGDRLLLTHYCMARNQPRMVAKRFDPASGELEFDFLDATNLASPGAGHMHSAKFRFLDRDRFASEWQFFESGKVKATEAEQYTRVR